MSFFKLFSKEISTTSGLLHTSVEEECAIDGLEALPNLTHDKPENGAIMRLYVGSMFTCRE